MNNNNNNTDNIIESPDSINFSYAKEDFYENEENFDEDDEERALTAPARPLTEIEEFRRSDKFNLLE
jgi:hypothetical protein